jgi:deoxyribonuclease (pyrimidine dimer)
MLAAPWCGHYTATPEALCIIRTRIAEKIAMKPSWYRYEGKRLDDRI